MNNKDKEKRIQVIEQTVIIFLFMIERKKEYRCKTMIHKLKEIKKYDTIDWKHRNKIICYVRKMKKWIKVSS